MKKLDDRDYQEVKSWVFRNGRQIDITLWQYHFENGAKESVLSALSYYQNKDGGFGHALEADSWNPNSSPATTLTAVNILKNVGFTDIKHPIMQGVFKFLDSGVYYSDNGWYFNIPSNNDYPHAPWWTYNMEANAVEGIGISAELAGFLMRFADKNSRLFEKALVLADGLIEKLKTRKKFGDMGVGGYCDLLESIQSSGLTGRFDTRFLVEKLTMLVNESIVRDSAQWVRYTVRPSDYIRSPSSIFYKGNEEIVDRELDYLVETRRKGGVWDITWSWFDNNDRYAKEFAISENWWKAGKAIEKVRFLKNFNRIDF